MKLEGPSNPESSDRPELPPQLENVKTDYKFLDETIREAARELGGTAMRIGGEGKIEHHFKFQLRHLLHQFTERFPKDDLPEAVPLRHAYTGEKIGVKAGNLVVDMTPPREAYYFLPRTYERYRVQPQLGPQFVPGSGQFIGSEEVKRQQHGDIFFGTMIHSVIPYPSEEIGGYAGELETDEIEKVLAAYKESARSEGAKEILAELSTKMAETKTTKEQQIRESVQRHAPRIRQRMQNFVRSIDENAKKLPNRIYINWKDEPGKDVKDLDQIFFLPQEERLIIVPKRKKTILGKTIRWDDFANAQDANSDKEFLNLVSSIENKLLDYIPEKYRDVIRYSTLP